MARFLSTKDTTALFAVPMKTLEEIRQAPVGLLTDDEINMLDPEGQAFARHVQSRMRREGACPGHERTGIAAREEANRGWHSGKCRHCGKDMSYDSGD